MDMPPIDIPILGRSGLIALIALLHIPFFVNFVMGAPVIAVITEWLAKKTGDPRYDKFARHLSTMAYVTVGIGAFGGIALVVANIGLFPRFFASSMSVFLVPLLIEIGAFLMEAIFIAIYYYTWKTMAHRPLHMLFGALGAIGAWLSGLLINGLASFMLTPGQWVDTKSVWHAAFNPSSLPSYTHRAVAAFSITGFFMVIYAIWAFRRAKTEGDQKYSTWALQFSSKWALIATALQVVPGVWYLTAIEKGTKMAAPEGSVIPKILGGELQFFWMGGIILAATAVLLVWFLGVQYPQAGLKKAGRIGLIASVVLILTTTSFMGFTRERARKPYLIYGVMYGNEMMAKIMPQGHDAAEQPDIDVEPTQPEIEAAIQEDSEEDTSTETQETAAPEEPAEAPPAPPDEDNQEEGLALFKDSNCYMCHSIDGDGGKILPLDGAGSRLTPDEIRQVLLNPPEGMIGFAGSEEELELLISFIANLK